MWVGLLICPHIFKYMITRIEIDGYRGTGKTYLCNKLKEYLETKNLSDRFTAFDEGLLTKFVHGTFANYEEFAKDFLPNFRNDTVYILVDDIEEHAIDNIYSKKDKNEAFDLCENLTYWRQRYKLIYSYAAVAYHDYYTDHSKVRPTKNPIVLFDRQFKSFADEDLKAFFDQLLWSIYNDSAMTEQEKTERMLIKTAIEYYKVKNGPHDAQELGLAEFKFDDYCKYYIEKFLTEDYEKDSDKVYLQKENKRKMLSL